MLSQEKIKHKEQLESQRKAFRKKTTLKTWPLQDMAMEHLHHLQDGKHSSSPFHGGDYLSSQSASSTGSTGGKRRNTLTENNSSSPTHRTSSYDEESTPAEVADAPLVDEEGPLWSKEPRMFATEKAHGKRKYLVGHFGRIADWYWRKCVNKHLYEVICEKTPCRLYFDLEFSKKFNKDVDEVALLEEFRKELAVEMKTHLDVTLERSHIIDMDSSTPEKFSRHWVVDVDHEGLFEDAPAVGRFVKRLVSRLAEEKATNQLQDHHPTLAENLFVQTKDANRPSCFIDLGVYTRNRLFRCFGSSKYGKPNRLEVAESNEYPLASLPESKGKAESPADNSIENAAPPTSTLEEYIAANNWAPHARILAATLVIPLGGSEGKRIFPVEEDESPPTSRAQTSGRVYQPSVSIHASKTPFPSLEKYVLEVLGCRGGTQGAIRAWSIEYGGPRADIPVSITFQMCRNRFCELIGREHKSNNIFWTIDFDSWTCIQGCHDPECFGRGAPIPIREDYLPGILEEFAAWRDEEFEKALMALNLDDLPHSTSNAEDEKAVVIVDEKAGRQNVTDGYPDKTGDRHDDDDPSFSISDEALLDAMSANPEQFP